ncbi:unnamed protein product [Protopolystoma xenopodis]|uniref:Cation/H+ exchanger domain-containing protein n=1 Tax=Protopolystoma xenopodis TaxID=117903 RepID=A0A3S5BP38_9PLAT|nr:unnamed protein product [Protopolystoma xenopodis]
MLRLELSGWGVDKGIPTLVMAASSIDDVIAISGFGVALAIALTTGQSIIATLVIGPLEALAGAAFGLALGLLLWLVPSPGLVSHNCSLLLTELSSSQFYA